jgi:hypothetical protein
MDRVLTEQLEDLMETLLGFIGISLVITLVGLVLFAAIAGRATRKW